MEGILFSKKIAYLSTLVLLFIALTVQPVNAQELVFKNAQLETSPNTAGKDGAVYRFSNVTTKVDALVKIASRSGSKVKLVAIDLSNTGFNNAFQPQVTYDNGTTPWNSTEWWMEFEISFVQTGTSVPVIVNKFDVTALDIDGNGDKIKEYTSFYNQKSYVLESRTLLSVNNIMEQTQQGMQLVGKKFKGPVKNFTNIDPTATEVMTTNKYEQVNKFRVRAGAESSGSSSAADRMYSLWFKSFTYQTPVEGSLPVKLGLFSAVKKDDTKVQLTWITEQELNVSHFVVERSFDGKEYAEAGLVFAHGNSNTAITYKFTDELRGNNKGMIYYRLRMVDLDGSAELSTVRLIKSGETKQTAAIAVFPNPVVNELRITLPANWQEQPVNVEIFNNNGQLVKRTVTSKANQTETMNVADLGTGTYVVKVSSGNESAVQRIIKAR